MLVSGATACSGAWQWAAAIAGWVGIVYVMFGGTRRLELRQNKNYGADPEYHAYVKKTPILLPFVPLCSVAGCTWLKGQGERASPGRGGRSHRRITQTAAVS